jgi:hypothetical protein
MSNGPLAFFDRYNVHARLYSGLLMALPVTVLTVSLVTFTAAATIVSLLASSGVLFLVTQQMWMPRTGTFAVGENQVPHWLHRPLEPHWHLFTSQVRSLGAKTEKRLVGFQKSATAADLGDRYTLPVGAELAIHGGDLRDRGTVVVGHDRRSWRYDCCI